MAHFSIIVLVLTVVLVASSNGAALGASREGRLIVAASEADAEHWRSELIGKRIVTGPVQDPSNEFSEADLPRPNRIYTQGSALTMDYNSNRLNVAVDPDSGRVVSVGYF